MPRRRRDVPTYDHYSPEELRHADEVLDGLIAARRGLKPYEGRCPRCGRVISSKAPNCARRWCSAVYPKWSRDQRRVTAEALREYGGLLLLTDVTLPGTPEQERHRRRVAIPWGADRRGEPKAVYKANRRKAESARPACVKCDARVPSVRISSHCPRRGLVVRRGGVG